MAVRPIESLPQHDDIPLLTRAIETAFLISAAALLVLHVFRFSRIADFFTWRIAIAVVIGTLLADFLSGVVHWSADTWGSESMPVIGRRFLRPFRIHHVNPDDLLRRSFIDTNGDVAMIVTPVLSSALLIPLESDLQRLAAAFLVALSACALPTNQVHQWAHMDAPPVCIRRLQQWGLLLRPEQHQLHHIAPYATNYCIAAGWCNPAVNALGVFPALERIISGLTGFQPRGEDRSFAARFEVSASSARGVAVEKSS